MSVAFAANELVYVQLIEPLRDSTNPPGKAVGDGLLVVTPGAAEADVTAPGEELDPREEVGETEPLAEDDRLPCGMEDPDPCTEDEDPEIDTTGPRVWERVLTCTVVIFVRITVTKVLRELLIVLVNEDCNIEVSMVDRVVVPLDWEDTAAEVTADWLVWKMFEVEFSASDDAPEGEDVSETGEVALPDGC